MARDRSDNEGSAFSRRQFLQAAGGGLALTASAVGIAQASGQETTHTHADHADHADHTDHAAMGHGDASAVGRIESTFPDEYLRTFHRGKPVPADALEKARRENWPTPDAFFEIHAVDREIEIAPGVFFPAWTYGLARDGSTELPLRGEVPGPTIRCDEDEEILIKFVNQGAHPHTLHFHGVHPLDMDGSMPDQFVNPGQVFWYRFRAEPYGLHLYHCHSTPLKRHIHKGLYGVFLVDPAPRRGVRTEVDLDPDGRPQEYVMVMNGFDTNFDGGNEVYAINSAAFYHTGDRMIRVRRNTLIRVHLVNVTEFDLINSFHLHANFFYTIRTGTRVMTWGDDAHMEENKYRFEFTDTVMMCQGERAILEFKLPHEGMVMFHAHQSEFAELGWMAFFQVEA